MPDDLKTKYVFLDTEVFRGEVFDYQSAALERLAELAESEHVSIVLTSITINEVKSNILDALAEAIPALRKFRSRARILRNLSDTFKNAFHESIKLEKTSPILIEQFEAYCKRVDAEILPIEDISIETIFEKYFNATPPFGKGEKKAEFPDAFVIATLRNWCDNTGDKLYVISNDSDIVSACEEIETLIPLRELAEFLDIVSAYLEKKRYDIAEQVLKACSPEIEARIREAFLDLGFYLDELNGEVSAIEVASLNILRSDIIDVDDQHATYSLLVEVGFLADVSYATSFVNGLYLDEVEEEIERTEQLKVEVIIAIDLKNPDDYELQEVNLKRETIVLDSWHGEAWPYK